MSERLENVKGLLLGAAILALIALLIGVWLVGAEWVSAHVLPFLSKLSALVTFVDLVAIIPLGFVRFTRKFAAWTLYSTSFLFGVTLWMYGFLATLLLWGRLAVIVGLCLAGVGVVPLAYLASLFKAQWSILANLVFLTVATFGARGLGVRFLVKDAEEAARREIELAMPPTAG
jgi:hypothetical protein